MPRTITVFGLSIVLVVVAMSITACDENSPSTTTPQASTQVSWKLDAMPDGGATVVKAKVGAKEGEPIVLVGRIGGRSEPISASSGLFIIMDPAIPSCADNPDDRCAKPWDYCCETQETITANAATIQLRDADGQPITLAEGDLEPLSRVTVVGTVAQRPNDDTLVVHATGVYVESTQH